MSDLAGPSAEATGLLPDVVYAGLDGLQGILELDLCAYLHAANGSGPQLYLRHPDLSELSSTDAFNLFAALRETLAADRHDDAVVHVGGFVALAITTRGARSSGLHVVGRRRRALDEREHQMASSLCRALGTVCHRLEEAGAPGGPLALLPAEVERGPVRMTVERVNGVARAEVSVPAGDETRDGQAEADSSTTAVARAVLNAVGAGLQLSESGEGTVGGERAVLALVEDGAGHRALGAALSGNDPLQAAAAAALDAVLRFPTAVD